MNLPYKPEKMRFQSSDPRNILPVKKVKQYKKVFFSDRAMGCSAGKLKPLAKRSRQRCVVDSTSDSQSDMHSSGFEFRSGHLLDFFMVITISNLQPRLSIANMLPNASWGF